MRARLAAGEAAAVARAEGAEPCSAVEAAARASAANRNSLLQDLEAEHATHPENHGVSKRNDNALVQHILAASIGTREGTDLTEIADGIMRTLLEMGSETPDNLNCSQQIEYGRVDRRQEGPATVFGLKVKGTEMLVSDVMHLVEDDGIPESVQQHYPELTDDQWSAVTRLTTMILLSLERGVWK